MKCKKCGYEGIEFYVSNKTQCKNCLKTAVNANRKKKSEYYKKYDAQRFKSDPRVKERHDRYAKSKQGKIAGSRSKKKWQEKNILKRAAHVIIGNAIRDGKVTRKDCCACGSNKNIHAHHDDYAKPLNVRWLCAACHSQWHRDNGEGKNRE